MLEIEIISLQNKISEKTDKNIKEDIIMKDDNNDDKYNLVGKPVNISLRKFEHDTIEITNNCNNKTIKIKLLKSK